jgi:hypothetical protein
MNDDPTVPRDPSPRDADASLDLLAEMMITGTDATIGRQEQNGQMEMVASSVLPREVLYATDADLEAMGITLGEPVDELFRRVTLPNGWTREGDGHAMWSYVLDDQGRRRIEVFYKAAFYDRRAHLFVVKDYETH